MRPVFYGFLIQHLSYKKYLDSRSKGAVTTGPRRIAFCSYPPINPPPGTTKLERNVSKTTCSRKPKLNCTVPIRNPWNTQQNHRLTTASGRTPRQHRRCTDLICSKTLAESLDKQSKSYLLTDTSAQSQCKIIHSPLRFPQNSAQCQALLIMNCPMPRPNHTFFAATCPKPSQQHTTTHHQKARKIAHWLLQTASNLWTITCWLMLQDGRNSAGCYMLPAITKEVKRMYWRAWACKYTPGIGLAADPTQSSGC